MKRQAIKTQGQPRLSVMLALAGWLATLAMAAAVYILVQWSGAALNTVATDSMVPTYQPTDMVFSLSPERITPKIGEAIIFETDYVGQHIPGHIHRIVGRNSDGSWITRGDANADPDGWRVPPTGIKGVAVFSIPGGLLRDPRLIGGMLFVLLAVWLWPREGDEDDDEETLCNSPQHVSALGIPGTARR